MLKFFIPILYTVETRYARHSLKGLMLFLAIYLIPQFILMACFSISEMWLWPIAIILVLDLYEIGYIQNDTETIKNEVNPTIRLSDKELLFYESYKMVIYCWRIFWGMALSFVFYYYWDSSIYICAILCILWFLIPLYYLYNSIRNVWNLPLLTVLTSYRIILPTLLCSSSITFLELLYMYLIYPFPTLLQQLSMGKFGIKLSNHIIGFFIENYNNRYLYRVKYYFLLAIVIFILISLNLIGIECLILPSYFFILRVILYLQQKGGHRG